MPDKSAQYKIGWLVCCTIGFSVIVNLSIIVYITATTEIRKFKFYWARFKRTSSRFIGRIKGYKSDKVKIGDGELFQKQDGPL